jgi:hypothetical protein
MHFEGTITIKYKMDNTTCKHNSQRWPAQPSAAADALQPPLLRRSGFQARLSASIRADMLRTSAISRSISTGSCIVASPLYLYEATNPLRNSGLSLRGDASQNSPHCWRHCLISLQPTRHSWLMTSRPHGRCSPGRRSAIRGRLDRCQYSD